MPSTELRADERSQQILRVPRDKTPGELVLDSGDRTYVLLFVVPGSNLAEVFESADTFMPVGGLAEMRFIARKAIACVTVHHLHVNVDDGLPKQECQKAVVRLRGGAVVRGELRWTAPPGRRRTLDYLNTSDSHFVVFDGDYIHFIATAAVLSVEEA